MKVVNNGLTIEIGGAFGHFPKEFVISALEKQIPKKPINRKGTTYFHCPVCEGNRLNNYCADCGQALDWSDTE